MTLRAGILTDVDSLLLEKRAKGPVTEEAIILGPSDEKGYIRWDSVEPGTYELYGGKDGKSQEFTFKKPQDKAMVDVTLVWNPPAE